MPEGRDLEGCMRTKSERKHAAIAGFDVSAAGDVVYPSGAAPANHESYVLHSVEQIRDRGSHDAGAGVELPKFLAVGCAIDAEHSVGTALEDEIAGCRKNSSTFNLGKRDAPYLMLLNRIPGEQEAGHGRNSDQLGQQWALVGCVLAAVPVGGVGDPTFVWNVQGVGTLSRGQIDKAGGRIEGHGIPVMRATRGGRNEYWVQAVVGGCGFDGASALGIDPGSPGD